MEEAKIKGKVGKPLGYRKHKSIFTGLPIDAPEYYKELRHARRPELGKKQSSVIKIDALISSIEIQLKSLREEVNFLKK